MDAWRSWPMDTLRELDWYAWCVEAGWRPLVYDQPASPWEALGVDYEKYRRDRDIASGEILPTLIRDDLDVDPDDFAGDGDGYRADVG